MDICGYSIIKLYAGIISILQWHKLLTAVKTCENCRGEEFKVADLIDLCCSGTTMTIKPFFEACDKKQPSCHLYPWEELTLGMSWLSFPSHVRFIKMLYSEQQMHKKVKVKVTKPKLKAWVEEG